MALPVKPVVKPSAIAGLTAAQISKTNPQHLKPHFFAGVGDQYLNPFALRCVIAFILFCKQATGVDLSCAGQGSGWRSYRTQVTGFQASYTTTWSLSVNGLANRFANTRKWNGTPANSGPGALVTYYLRKGAIPKAVPGTGWHPYGLALDFAIFDALMDDGYPVPGGVRSVRSNPLVWQWMQANALSCGLSWENPNVGVDDPHLHYFAGDKVPARVLQLEAYFAGLAKH
jgi:hypothetical protein